MAITNDHVELKRIKTRKGLIGTDALKALKNVAPKQAGIVTIEDGDEFVIDKNAVFVEMFGKNPAPGMLVEVTNPANPGLTVEKKWYFSMITKGVRTCTQEGEAIDWVYSDGDVVDEVNNCANYEEFVTRNDGNVVKVRVHKHEHSLKKDFNAEGQPFIVAAQNTYSHNFVEEAEEH